MTFDEFYISILQLLSYFKLLGSTILEFLFADFLGQPLIYWLLGAGLIFYLTKEIIKALADILPD